MEQLRWWLTVMGTGLILLAIVRSIYFAVIAKRRAEKVGLQQWAADLAAEAWGFFAASVIGIAMLVGAVLISVW